MEPAYDWLLTLAEAENVTDAAAVLGMSQPALSRRLAALERDLGTPLFDRPGRRLVLNDAGRIYSEAAHRAEMTMNVARQRIAEIANGHAGTLRFGFLHSFGPWLVPRLLERVASAHPQTLHHLVQDAAGTIGRLVADGDLDIGLVSPRPTPGGGLAWKQIARQPIVVAVPGSHRFAGRKSLDVHSLADESFITMPQHYGMRRVLEECCATAGFRPNIGIECQELGTAAGLVEAGLGIALLPAEEHSKPAGTISFVRLTDPAVHRDIGLIWATHRAVPAPARTLRDLDQPVP